MLDLYSIVSYDYRLIADAKINESNLRTALVN